MYTNFLDIYIYLSSYFQSPWKICNHARGREKLAYVGDMWDKLFPSRCWGMGRWFIEPRCLRHSEHFKFLGPRCLFTLLSSWLYKLGKYYSPPCQNFSPYLQMHDKIDNYTSCPHLLVTWPYSHHTLPSRTGCLRSELCQLCFITSCV